MLSYTQPTQKKQRRVTQACDFCHRRGLKCKPQQLEPPVSFISAVGVGSTCQTCIDYEQDCTRKRTPKKRGTKPRMRVAVPAQNSAAAIPVTAPILNASTCESKESSTARTTDLADRRTITALLDVYLDSVHPVFPLYCERELWVRWRDGTLVQDETDYMSLTAMCALSAQHVGNGALFTHDRTVQEIQDLRQLYLDEAVRLVPSTYDKPNLNLVRSYGFLALIGIQNGNNMMLHRYLGLYHGLAALMSLHDEHRWPSGMPECHVEVRRRLWWAMYRLEVHAACVFGSTIRSSEAMCNVGYPAGQHHPAFVPGRNGAFEEWFVGWNTTTDLYRILEHVLAAFRTRRFVHKPILNSTSLPPSPNSIVGRLSQIQQELQPQFSMASSRSDDSGRNRCGFQASNILCTIHLARLLSCISNMSNVSTACQIAEDMVCSLSGIPSEYIRAIGSPLIQQLAGVGHMLVGVTHQTRLDTAELALVKGVVRHIIGYLDSFPYPSMIITLSCERLSTQLAELESAVQAAPGENARVDVNDGSQPRSPIEPQCLSADASGSWSPFLIDNVPRTMEEQEEIIADVLSDFCWAYLKFP